MSALRRGFCLCLAALVSGGAFAKVQTRPAADFRQFFALGQNGRITVDNRYGNVSIVAWDRDDVLVEAIKQAADSRGADEARIVVQPANGSLAIRTQYEGDADRLARHPAKVEYRISVPRSTNLADVKLGNGGLTISGVAGPVKASSVNGSITARKLEGRAELSTVNGKLEAAFEHMPKTQAVSLRSVNGAIRLLLPSDANANLDARNVSGGIDSEFGRPSRADGAEQLVVRGPGARIRLDNVNGGISIHSTWTRAPHRTEL